MIAWSLAAVSVLWGLGAFLLFGRLTNRAALRTVRKQLVAHLLEIRLYSEEPALVWNAQKAIVRDNLRFLTLTALPVAVMAVPFAFLYGPLDSVYGWGPLEVGHSAVVTLQLSREPAEGSQYKLLAPPGIAVETPPVRDFAGRRISWRIRPETSVRGDLRVALDGGTITRSIAAGTPTLSCNRRRESSPGAEWMEVDYPGADVAIAGLSLPWLAWFLILSIVSAGALAVWPRRRVF